MSVKNLVSPGCSLSCIMMQCTGTGSTVQGNKKIGTINWIRMRSVCQGHALFLD